MQGLIIAGIVLLVVVVTFVKTIRIVPQKEAWIVERLGKYHKTLEAGFHILFPYIDVVKYKRSLKEEALDVPQQSVITADNISLGVDGVLYLQVVDAKNSAYGIDNYKYAATQLAQTTMRSVFGKKELDETFEARDEINQRVVQAVDEASDPWGVKVTRYEIKDIEPPQSIRDAMEKQMRAEREKRAEIARSEGEMQAKINEAEGEKEYKILNAEGEKQKRIAEAEGRAAEIEKIATATSNGIKMIAAEINKAGGKEAVNLRLGEQYIKEFGNIAKQGNTMIIPADLANVGGFVASAQRVLTTIRDDKASV